MIDGSEKRNRQLAFEFQNSHVCEKPSKAEIASFTTNVMNLYLLAATGTKRCYVTTKHSII